MNDPAASARSREGEIAHGMKHLFGARERSERSPIFLPT